MTSHEKNLSTKISNDFDNARFSLLKMTTSNEVWPKKIWVRFAQKSLLKLQLLTEFLKKGFVELEILPRSFVKASFKPRKT